MAQLFSPKDPSESVILTFDFQNILVNQADLLVSASWSATDTTGVDINPNIIALPPSIDRTTTTAIVSGGVVNSIYTITVVAHTTSGQILKMIGSLSIKVQS
jgi:hypothetical protein